MKFKQVAAISLLSLICLFPVGCVQSTGGETQGPEASLSNHVDPVCNMSVSDDNAKAVHEHEDKKYYFCSEHCKESFKKEPHKYVKKN